MDFFKLEAKEKVHKPCKLVDSFFSTGVQLTILIVPYMYMSMEQLSKWIVEGGIQVFHFWGIYM